MAAFKILTANRAEQIEEWLQLWSCHFGKNIFAHPEFIKLFCRPGDSALCACLELYGQTLMFPFVMRPLSVEKWAGIKCNYYDMISPYSYGGLFCSDKNKLTGAQKNMTEFFWDQLDNWAKNSNVVTCFVRFSPDSYHMESFSGRLEQVSTHVSLSLNAQVLDIWNDFAHKVRTNIRRAVRNGLKVEVDIGGKRIAEFKKIYYGTMERRNAQRKYYLSEQFFSSIMEKFSGQYVFFHALQADKVISTELVLISNDRLYSFLGGTDKEALKLYPNEIIKYAAIRWGIENGKKTYELGGGYGGLDSLFRYKKSFSPQGLFPLMGGKKIYDETAYWELYELRSRYEIDNGNTIRLADGFFPAYRKHAIKIKSSDDGVQSDNREDTDKQDLKVMFA